MAEKGQLGVRETNQGAGIGAIDAEERNGGLVAGAGRGSGLGVCAGGGEADGDWGAGDRDARGAGESPAGEHFEGEGRWRADAGRSSTMVVSFVRFSSNPGSATVR